MKVAHRRHTNTINISYLAEIHGELGECAFVFSAMALHGNIVVLDECIIVFWV